MDDLFDLAQAPAAGVPPAAQLASALQAGDLPSAMRLIDGLPHKEAETLMVQLGFSSLSYGRTTETRRLFWRHFETQLVAAARLRVDGFSLHKQDLA